MAKTTITEALAELKTIAKRLEKKRAFVLGNLTRQEMLKDPHEKDGGSRAAVDREMQAIRDLEERVVRIRAAIAEANRRESIAIEGSALDGAGTRCIADWLSWRRDVAPMHQQFLAGISKMISEVRAQAARSQLRVNAGEEARPQDVSINIDERAHADRIEQLEAVLGRLDGLLSLKNATVTIDVD